LLAHRPVYRWSAAYALSQFIASKMNFNLQGYRIVPLAYLLQIIVAILVPLAAGFIPINSGSRVKVQTAIRQQFKQR
jgi:hypothetical protein